MTFGTMKADIASDLERTLADDASASETWDDVIGRFINKAIKLYRGKKWWFLERPTAAALTSATTSGNSYVAEYAGLIRLDSLRITISGQTLELALIDFSDMEQRHDGTTLSGQPFEFNRYAGRVRLYPTPDDIYTLTWSGTFETDTLALDADANVWTDEGELLILAMAKLMLQRDYIKSAEDIPAALQDVALAKKALDTEHSARTGQTRIKAGW